MIPGRGVQATVQGHTVLAGSPALLEEQGIAWPAAAQAAAQPYLEQGCTMICLGVDGMAAGLIALADTLRPEAASMVAQLQSEGVTPVLLTGDHENAARHIAQSVGIQELRAACLPQDKMDYIAASQQQGSPVCMVGDGINDTQALALADVSIAMGKGTDVAMDVSQVTLLTDDLQALPQAVTLSRRTVAMIWQNLFWAFVYNLLSVPLAAGVLYLFGIQWQISPMWASALMACSSISVVLNSLRLKWGK